MGPRVLLAPALLTLSLQIILHIYFISSWLPQFFGYKVHSVIRRTPNLAI